MLNCYYMDYTGGCSDEQSLVLYEQLNESRKIRVDKIKNPDMKKRQILTGTFVQHCLSKELGINASDLRLAENEYGKPNVVGHDIHFNLSHSGKYAVIAVSDSDVGIDIECKTKNCMKLAKRFFCKEEYDNLVKIDDETEQKRLFLHYWTIKEAYVKCIGTGLVIPMNSFCAKNDGQGWMIEKDEELLDGQMPNAKVNVGVFDFDNDYVVSICSTSDLVSDKMINLTFESNANVKNVFLK